jgi:WD40 repeat protein
VKHSRGGSKKSGKKITGLSFRPGDDRKLLVTSNDSRIRVYDGYSLACKYKGHKNNNSQIRAGFSPGAEFIVCGSEDENVYVLLGSSFPNPNTSLLPRLTQD